MFSRTLKIKFIALLFLLSLSSLLTAHSAASPSSGSPCSKQGLIKFFQGKNYECIKSGKKLIWSKGKAVAKQSRTPVPPSIPSPTPTSIVSASPSPTTTSLPSPTPSQSPTFTLAEGPAFQTAEKFSRLLFNTTLLPTSNTYESSPNLDLDTVRFMRLIQERHFIFWRENGITFEKPISTYFFTELDKAWLSKKDVPLNCLIETWFSSDFRNRADGRTCQTSDKKSVILFPLGSDFIKSREKLTGFGIQAAAHEIEHVVQNEAFKYKMPDPCWFREGLTTYSVWIETSFDSSFVGMSKVKKETFESLMSKLSRSQILIGGKAFQDWSAREWMEILNYRPANPVCWGRNSDGTVVSNPINFGYAAGPFVVEKLYIDFGLPKSIEFMREVGYLNDFEKAFNLAFNTTYQQWMFDRAIPWLLAGGA